MWSLYNLTPHALISYFWYVSAFRIAVRRVPHLVLLVRFRIVSLQRIPRDPGFPNDTGILTERSDTVHVYLGGRRR